MSSNESEAYKIMTNLDVDYVLVIFGGVIGYSGDDINKFLWMVRIAEGEHPKDIQVFRLAWVKPSCTTSTWLFVCFQESNYFSERGEFRVDSEASQTMLNCLMYKLSYYRFGDMKVNVPIEETPYPVLYCIICCAFISWTSATQLGSTELVMQ